MPLELSIHDDPPPDAADVVDRGLDEANDAAGVLQDVRPLGAFVRDEGRVVGGAVGRTWGECCELQQLWVDAAFRGRGLGERLLRAFEQRAAERGCTLVHLTTFSFQAPGFYAGRGYRVEHELRGYAHGVCKFTMTRQIGAHAPGT